MCGYKILKEKFEIILCWYLDLIFVISVRDSCFRAVVMLSNMFRYNC